VAVSRSGEGIFLVPAVFPVFLTPLSASASCTISSRSAAAACIYAALGVFAFCLLSTGSHPRGRTLHSTMGSVSLLWQQVVVYAVQSSSVVSGLAEAQVAVALIIVVFITFLLSVELSAGLARGLAFIVLSCIIQYSSSIRWRYPVFIFCQSQLPLCFI
jgi:hypothetical protein